VKSRIWLAGLAALSLVRSVPADAGQIRSPVSVFANTIGQAGGSTSHLIDQSGLAIPFISGGTDYDTYIALDPTSAVVSQTTGWAASTSRLPGYLEFDLGSELAISGFVLWNQSGKLSVNSFALSSATDSAFTSNVTSLGTFTATGVLTAQTYDFPGDVTVIGEFVRMEIFSSNGGSPFNLGEVAFDTEVIPEPLSLAGFCMGFGGLALVRRRKTRGIRASARTRLDTSLN
jgi:hypothetical protein